MDLSARQSRVTRRAKACRKLGHNRVIAGRLCPAIGAYAFLSIAALLIGAGGAQAQDVVPAQKGATILPGSSFTWESRNKTYNALPLSFENLYGTLANIIRKGGAIPIKEWRASPDQRLFGKDQRAEVARAYKLYDGKYYPDNLDELICALNPQICTQGTTNWRVKPGGVINLPDVTLEAYTELREYEKKRGDKISAIVVRDRRGCKEWDATCERFIKNLNSYKPDVLEDDSSGTILVPTLAYRAEVEITNFGRAAAPPPPNSPPSKPASIEALKPLKPNIVPEAEVSVQGVSDECPPEAERGTPERVAELINYHADAPVLADLSKAEIGLVDLNVFMSHCKFNDRLEFVKAPPTGITSILRPGSRVKWSKDNSPEAVAACGSYSEASTLEHGTHIMGIINSLQAARSIPGQLGNYQIIAFEKPHIGRHSAISDMDRVIAKMRQEEKFGIINLSLGQRMNGDAAGLSPAIRQLEASTRVLFVAAAGNLLSNETSHHVTRDDTCDVWPACQGSTNLISVVATDLDEAAPKPIMQSNTGTAFDIAAPGRAIVSTISGHKLGCMNGTSQASAIVASAAALLMSSDSGLHPAHVKNRLIYSSDLLRSLEGMVRGGRLNVGRALNWNVDSIEVANGEALQGTIVQWPDTDRPFTREDGDQSDATWESLRRLHRLGDNRYQIYFLKRPGDEKSALRSEKVRFRKLKYLNEQMAISIPPRPGESDAVPHSRSIILKEIVDYTGRIRLPHDS